MYRAVVMRLLQVPVLPVLAVLLCLALPPAARADPPSNRNILFIAVDDLRNWVGYGGDYAGTVHTPHIDALAAVSTRYLNAYASVPQCVGSRTSVMMGMSPATHRLTRPMWGVEEDYLAVYSNPQVKSLPEVLHQHGYYTAVTGKVFNNTQAFRWDQQGPDPEDLTGAFTPGPDGTFLQALVLPPGEEHVDQTVANWASGFLASYSGTQPFFLAVGFREPHVPWRVPQWAYDLYPPEEVVVSVPAAGDLDDEPAAATALAHAINYQLVLAAGRATDYTRAYLASLSHTDAMLGQLLAALAASPYAGSTDIVFWSDHGYHTGEKFHWGKNTFWEAAVRVPLLVSSPGNANYPPVDVTAAVSLLDIAPTVLELAGVAPYPQFAGTPLRLAGSHGAVEIFFRNGKATVSQAGRKSIDYDLGTPGAQDQAGYDLVVDQDELDNLGALAGC